MFLILLFSFSFLFLFLLCACNFLLLFLRFTRQVLPREQHRELLGVLSRWRHVGGGGEGTPPFRDGVEPRDGHSPARIGRRSSIRRGLRRFYAQWRWVGDDGLQARSDAEGERGGGEGCPFFMSGRRPILSPPQCRVGIRRVGGGDSVGVPSGLVINLATNKVDAVSFESSR